MTYNESGTDPDVSEADALDTSSPPPPQRRARRRVVFTIAILAVVACLIVLLAILPPYKELCARLVLGSKGATFWLTKTPDGARVARIWEPADGVDFSQSTVSDADMQWLHWTPNLTFVVMSGCRVTDSGIAHLAALQQLDRLCLDGTLVTDEGLAALGRALLSFLSLRDTRVTGRGLAYVKDVRSLHLGNTPLDDDGARCIAGLASLHVLGLDKTKVTDRGILALAKIPDLQALDVMHTQVTGLGMNQFPKLRILGMSYNPVTRESLHDVGACRSLERLSLNGVHLSGSGLQGLVQLEVLNCDNAVVDDAVIESILKMKRLRTLGLSGTTISDKSIVKLAALPSLTILDLGQRDIPFATRKKIVLKNPGLHVVWKDYEKYVGRIPAGFLENSLGFGFITPGTSVADAVEAAEQGGESTGKEEQGKP